MKTKISIALGSLLGACALHLVLTACGSHLGQGSGTPDASAQTASTCKAWKTGFFLYQVPTEASGGNLPLSQLVATAAMPDGWEPIGTSPAYDTNTVTVLVSLRQCVSQ